MRKQCARQLRLIKEWLTCAPQSRQSTRDIKWLLTIIAAQEREIERLKGKEQ